MTREHIQAMLDRKTLKQKYYERYAFFDGTKSAPFRFRDGTNADVELTGAWAYDDWVLVEPPKTRPMTRDEVLVFMLQNPKMLVLDQTGGWNPSGYYGFTASIDTYQYKLLQDDGTFTEPRRFEVTE